MHRLSLLLLVVNLVVLTTARVVVKDNVGIKQEAATEEEDDLDPVEVIRLLVDIFTVGMMVYEHCGPHAASGSCSGFFMAVVVVLVVVVVVLAVCNCLGITLDQDASSVRNRQNAADGLRLAGFMGALSVANQRLKSSELDRKCL